MNCQLLVCEWPLKNRRGFPRGLDEGKDSRKRTHTHRVISNDSYEDLEGLFEIGQQRSLLSYHSTKE